MYRRVASLALLNFVWVIQPWSGRIGSKRIIYGQRYISAMQDRAEAQGTQGTRGKGEAVILFPLYEQSVVERTVC
jgi:hypothetical protein